MELKDCILIQLDVSKGQLNKALATLKPAELAWRPAYGCSSIGLILFHIIRREDYIIQAQLQNKPEIWESGKWHEKLGLPATAVIRRFTIDQVNAFQVPDLKDMLAYFEAVRQSTVDYVKGLKQADLEKKITEAQGEATVAVCISTLIPHISKHMGEISYIRGIERGMGG